jgi:hypothetical protein
MNPINRLAGAPAARATMVLALLGMAACSTGPAPRRAVATAPAAPVKAIAPAADARLVPDAVAASAEVVWALRGGLNVAALLCGDQALRNNYNRILKTHRSLLDQAYTTEQGRYRQLHGSAGQARHDAAMTRLYNGFASVPDRRRFCSQSGRIAAEVLALPSIDVPRIAARALTAIEPGAMRLVNAGY